MVAIDGARAPSPRQRREIEFRRQSNSSGPANHDMSSTCLHAQHMSRMIRIRNVPDALHRQLKSRAAVAGMSLSDFIKDALDQLAGRPTLAQIAARLRLLEPVEITEPVTSILDAARAAR